MWLEKDTVRKDLEQIGKVEFIPWEKLRGKTIFVTGATGLIGYSLVNVLLYFNQKEDLNLTVVTLVRDKMRAVKRFEGLVGDTNALRMVVGTVEELPTLDMDIDYIIHGASQTASRAFVEQPVETIITAVKGTVNLLELARAKACKGMVYLSSMEVYGHPQRGQKVTEDMIGSLTPLDVRNSYPISKQECESLCTAYAKEYGVPVMVARLTQTFGPGVNYNDNRIFAYFGRCIKEKTDIVLKTKGETERSYLYTIDAATAILTIMLKGESGAAYNCADENTYCSIAEMAEMVAKQNGIKVCFDIQDESANGYPAALYMDLDTSKLKSLGWKVLAGGGIILMYEKMVSMMEEGRSLNG